MLLDKVALVNEYFKKVKAANKEHTKKEAFKDLLNRLYANNHETKQIIDAMTLGAETTIVNIPRKNESHRGSADTLYNKIIIEYENDLKRSLKHAKEQLAGYMIGQFNAGEGYNFTLIASDFINWKVFSLDINSIEKLGKGLNEEDAVLNEIVTASFTLTQSNAEDFYYWIDRFLFKEEKQKATLKRIEESFGYQSNVFIENFRELSQWFNEAKKLGEVQVSFEQWKKFLSIAYGKFDASDSNFLIHTYLSVFSKMLAYSVISSDDYIDEEEMKGILDGSIFYNFHISNFIDNDFFHWVKSDSNFKRLKKSFRLITQEISAYDFANVDEDVLKGVYQELIDLDTRHALGEYYTPDWLCERVVKEYNFKATDKILDPSCGSGSFLRAAIHRMRELHPEISAESLSKQIYGIDIHPLSVQIAKTTMLIALGKEVKKLKRPIHINIILSNTLLSPEGVKDLFGGNFKMNIDKHAYTLNTQVLEDVALFDTALDVCEDLAEQTTNKTPLSVSTIINTINKQYQRGGINEKVFENFYSIYEGLKKVKEEGRDSIWKFILQNLYKPYFLKGKFDYLIGNPPWFTYSSIRNEEYQDTLNQLAEKYQVKPNKIADYPHLEIAAIFLAHCINYFLKDHGSLAFVLPRSFFSASQHDNTRSGQAKGFKLNAIWDLKDVSPLFRIPSCVLFAEPTKDRKKVPVEGWKGWSFNGNLPAHNCNLKTAKPKLTEEEVTWFYSKQGNGTAFSKVENKSKNKVNPYKALFKQGATIVPRSFYFIELTHETPDFDDRIIQIKTAEAIKPDAKIPWKQIDFTGNIESQFVFKTALSKSILPFNLYKPDIVVLPVTINEANDGIKDIKISLSKDLQHQGYRNAARWFNNTENAWISHRTQKSADMLSIDRLNFQRGITDQNLNLQFLVLYNSSAKDANATVVDRKELDIEFIAESVTYVFYTSKKQEAYYLTAILNSSTPNKRMKDYQATGLFGARHVHKKILDIYYPKFDEKSKVHQKLSILSEKAHQKAKKYLEDNPPKQELSSIFLGRLRVEIKNHLKEEMTEIDKLVSEIIR